MLHLRLHIHHQEGGVSFCTPSLIDSGAICRHVAFNRLFEALILKIPYCVYRFTYSLRIIKDRTSIAAFLTYSLLSGQS
jgi:hypothetical protein